MSETQTKVLTNTVLKGLLEDTVLARSMANDMNTTVTAGVYYVSHLTANRPEGAYEWGVAVVFVCNNGILIQIYYPRTNPSLYIRMCYDGLWEAWRKFTPS